MNAPAFGTHALAPWRERLRLRAGRLRSVHKGLSSLVRRAAQAGTSAPFDVVNGEARLRLWPEENIADRRAFMGLSLRDPAEENAMRRAAANAKGGVFRFVDVGANSGMYSLALARAGASRRVHGVAIEANPIMFERLMFNLEASGVAWTLENDGVLCVPCAVSDHNGTVRFDTSSSNLGEGRIASEGREVSARTLLSILDEAGLDRIDMLKIDVEGHEVPALAPYLENAPRERHPKVVLAETLHDDGTLASLMARHGYRTVASTRMDTIWERNEKGANRGGGASA